MTNEDLQQIQNLVTAARRVLVVTHKNPSVDTMASALSLYLALVKLGKEVAVAMESQPLVEVANLVGIDKVVTALGGNKNLVVTYQPYSVGDFTNVRYNDEQGVNDAFKLTITPREGFTPDPKNFNFAFTGAGTGSFDLIFTVELLEPTQAGALFDATMFGAVPIINIDNHDPNRDYGKFNLVEPDAASISEIVTFFLRAVNATIDADIANNLYQGIASATNNFQTEKVAAATFEAAAICLRAGAKSFAKAQDKQPVQPVAPTQPFDPAQGKPVQPAQPANNPIPTDWTGQPKTYRGTSTV